MGHDILFWHAYLKTSIDEPSPRVCMSIQNGDGSHACPIVVRAVVSVLIDPPFVVALTACTPLPGLGFRVQGLGFKGRRAVRSRFTCAVGPGGWCEEHVIQRTFKPRLLSHMAPCDVASNILHALLCGMSATNQPSTAVLIRRWPRGGHGGARHLRIDAAAPHDLPQPRRWRAGVAPRWRQPSALRHRGRNAAEDGAECGGA
jgi:hypothetical protein